MPMYYTMQDSHVHIVTTKNAAKTHLKKNMRENKNIYIKNTKNVVLQSRALRNVETLHTNDRLNTRV